MPSRRRSFRRSSVREALGLRRLSDRVKGLSADAPIGRTVDLTGSGAGKKSIVEDWTRGVM